MPSFDAVIYQPMVVTVRQSKKASTRSRDLVKQAKCLSCEGIIAQTKGRARRGLCARCYLAARRAIASGKTSEAELMRQGLMAKEQSGGRPPQNPISKKFAGAKV